MFWINQKSGILVQFGISPDNYFVSKMEINPNVENLETNSTSEDEVWGMPKYQQNYLSNLTNLTDEQYLAVVKFVAF